ncbi:MAG: PIN domain-containing protein [Anaerolineae bacterium]|nr:PIN domain-containing protein [Anaerolineae bacterium]
MKALVDSSFLYATIDRGDKNHIQVVGLLANLTDDLFLPTTVLEEVTYLLQARLGHVQVRYFVHQLQDSPIQIEVISKSDLTRIYELVDQYADLKLDFVDASLVAVAERLKIHRILTIAPRNFRSIQPNHCDCFEILP